MSSDEEPAAFAVARLDEDEAAARAAPGENWRSFTEDDVAGASVYDEQWVLLYPARYDHDNPLSAEPGATGPQYIQRSRDALAAHIARHDPARALREIETGRRILERHRDCRTMSGYCRDRHVGPAPCPDLADLLARWDDHPGYRPGWKP